MKLQELWWSSTGVVEGEHTNLHKIYPGPTACKILNHLLYIQGIDNADLSLEGNKRLEM
jgi:hypothetical protein